MIKNIGNKKAGASNTSLTIDDVFITSDYVDPLNPGERRTESFNYSWKCTNKSDRIKVCADYLDEVDERETGGWYNNCITETWICKDLLIGYYIWSDDSTIYYEIANIGCERIEESYTSLTIDGVFITSDYVDPLNPGERRTENFNYSWKCTNKSDEIEVCADYKNEVEEGDEENNCINKTWKCSPVVKEWSKTFGGSGWDVANSVQQTSDGGYIIAGYTGSYGAGSDDAWLIKTDSSGKEEWSKTFGGSDYDEANSVQQTSDGGYIIAGRTNSYGAGYRDAWLIKTDSSGKEEWSKTFGGSGWDVANSVQQTSDGGYIIAGRTNSYGAGDYDAWLIKTDSSGKEKWSKTFGGSDYDEANSVQQTSDGGYIIAGRTNSYGAGPGDAWLIKTDSLGKEEWSKTFGGSGHDRANSVQQTSDGGYIIAGRTNSYGAGPGDAWLIKTDSEGNEEWSKTFGGSRYDGANSVQQTLDGGYIIAGYTESYGASSDAWLIKTDSSGKEEWSKTFGDPRWYHRDDRAHSIQQTSDGGYIIAGRTESYGAGDYDAWLIKLALTPPPPRKDLVITDIWSDNCTIYYKIRNRGIERVEASSTSLTIDDVFITSDYVPSLEAGEERTESFNFTWNCTNKSDEIKVCADYKNEVEEGDEENNCRTETWVCPTIYVPDYYSSIQEAVNAAPIGGTIIVRDGTYNENIDVNKRLTIKSENGPEKTIVQAANSRNYVFKVTADYVNISGFTVEGAGYCGIYLKNSDHCNVHQLFQSPKTKTKFISGFNSGI